MNRRSCELNDSIYELYKPSKSDAEMDILFFHGLHTRSNSVPYLSTWRSRNAEESLWPKEWLPEEYPNARVLTISYDGNLNKYDEGGTMDLYLVAESLWQDLLLGDVGQTRPVIFVAHSFGGLVVKRLCFFAFMKNKMQPGDDIQRKSAFLKNVKGIFCYATPHQGSGFTDSLKFDDMEGELVGIVKIFNKELARLNQDFQDVRKQFVWDIGGVFETLPTDLGGGLCRVIVPEASARTENTIPVREDHFSICQPAERSSTTYQSLISFIAKVQQKVVKEICSITGGQANWQTLPRIQVGPLSDLADGEIERILEKHSALGLWGAGGIGKTTLSKASFNALCSKFEYTLFIESVKFIRGDSKELQGTLLQEMHHKGKKVKGMSNNTFLKGKKLLAVLDDVEMDRDINIVCDLQEICSPSSRFILTSRDRKILDGVDKISILEVKVLEEEWSERLFRGYATLSGRLLAWQEKYSKDIVQHCQGLPLLLEVMGKYLKSAKIDVWKDTLNALREADCGRTDDEVLDKLKLSYNSLGYEEKQMFIDATTFFQGEIIYERRRIKPEWKLREAQVAWEATYRRAAMHWRTLVDRSLVYDVEEDSRIKVHELMRDLGRKLADRMKEIPWRILQIPDARSLSKTLLEVDNQPEKVHTIRLQRDAHVEPRVESCFRCSLVERLQEMENLQYLQLSKCKCCDLVRSEVILPGNLVIFSCSNLGQKISFASCSNLVILSMAAIGTELLPDFFRYFLKLQVLHLEAKHLECLPESFDSLKRLHTCKLRCPYLKNLSISFDAFQNLLHLEIESERLENLPETFGSLGNLQSLSIKSPALERLSKSFGSLGHLRELTIASEALKSLPGSFGKLGNLQSLSIKSQALERLPESFGSLGHLRELTIASEVLKRLSGSFGSLGNLQSLSIKSPALERLSDSFGNLGHLRELTIESKALKKLPESFGSLGNLQSLSIKSQVLERLLESFSSLGHLRELTIASEALERLPKFFGSLGNLQSLVIENQALELPESFGSLGDLQYLTIKSQALERLPKSFGNLENLQSLVIESQALELPESFGNLENLQNLVIESQVQELPESFGNLGDLQYLEIKSPALERLPKSFSRLRNLQHLIIESQALKSLPEYFGRLTNLQGLLIKSKALRRFPESFGDLENLQNLVIESQALKSLPESFGDLKNLQCLFIESKALLPESFDRLRNLQHLFIKIHIAFPWTASLPESFGSLRNLQSLSIESRWLEKLPESFDSLRNLRSLSIKSMWLQELPQSFGNLRDLQELIIMTEELKGLPESFGNLRNLQCLKIVTNHLKGLPESFGNLRDLQELTIVSKDLKGLPESFGNLRDLQELTIVTEELKLPESFGNLGHLRELTIATEDLKGLPESFGHLGDLQELTIGTGDLIGLPESFGNLRDLKKLRIVTEELKLPESFGNLRDLQELAIVTDELKLPESFGSLRNLQFLVIESETLKSLPDSFGNLEHLRELRITSCALERLLESFGSLGNLQYLTIKTEAALMRLPELVDRMLEGLEKSFDSLENLQKLKICSDTLEGYPDFFYRLGDLQESTVHDNTLDRFPESRDEVSSESEELQASTVYRGTLVRGCQSLSVAWELYTS